MNEIKINFFNCEDCIHKNVCKHIKIDVPEFRNEITGCIDNYIYKLNVKNFKLSHVQFRVNIDKIKNICYNKI